MADFLLVHGAAHGAWCWRDLIPALTARGHSVRAIDLPGHGGDLTPIADVTLDAYAIAILSAIDSPVTLVGHSMAGYPISLAAERAPDKITRLVYLCAYLPAGDRTLAERRQENSHQPLLPALIHADDRKSFRVDPARSRDLFYHDCPPGTATYANARLCAQAVQPSNIPCPLGAAYASVPRSYIRCMDDHTIPPELQVAMTADWPARDVCEMPTGHSPFFADPEGLAELLGDIADQDG
ncbi:alpha/beta fold hydrolase [Alisedimentitalea sp. MJ-SS2]|uniref:alpha/beta fold hydrolase n=1 Tax=Aliisedimentitalea sp. MJ-SS2 TaxID=3049795 RepID=UPI0029092762|nr:alpha/beta fold hydrolase [Alisedimentitalea sp. MJ-SS2]MDU8925968.1 alpha/beta fold hydrolase [Alisedimentitalea sp. MJ-SS2]